MIAEREESESDGSSEREGDGEEEKETEKLSSNSSVPEESPEGEIKGVNSAKNTFV